jgi:hypothetical protein
MVPVLEPLGKPILSANELARVECTCRCRRGPLVFPARIAERRCRGGSLLCRREPQWHQRTTPAPIPATLLTSCGDSGESLDLSELLFPHLDERTSRCLCRLDCRVIADHVR